MIISTNDNESVRKTANMIRIKSFKREREMLEISILKRNWILILAKSILPMIYWWWSMVMTENHLANGRMEKQKINLSFL